MKNHKRKWNQGCPHVQYFEKGTDFGFWVLDQCGALWISDHETHWNVAFCSSNGSWIILLVCQFEGADARQGVSTVCDRPHSVDFLKYQLTGGKKTPRMHSNYSCNCSCFSAVSEDWIQIVRNKYSIMMLPKEWGRNTRMPWPGKRKTFSELSTALSFVEVIHLCNFVTWESEHWLIRKPFSPKG